MHKYGQLGIGSNRNQVTELKTERHSPQILKMLQSSCIAPLLALCLLAKSLESISLPTSNPSHQSIVEAPTTLAKFSSINVRADTRSTEPLQLTQIPASLRTYQRDPDRSVRLNLSDLRNRFARLENMITVLERVSYALSKPAAVIDAIRLFALAVSSIIVTAFNVS